MATDSERHLMPVTLSPSLSRHGVLVGKILSYRTLDDFRLLKEEVGVWHAGD